MILADLSEVPTEAIIAEARWAVLRYAAAGGLKPDNPIVLQTRQKVAADWVRARIEARLAGKSREPIRGDA